MKFTITVLMMLLCMAHNAMAIGNMHGRLLLQQQVPASSTCTQGFSTLGGLDGLKSKIPACAEATTNIEPCCNQVNHLAPSQPHTPGARPACFRIAAVAPNNR